MPFAHEQLVVDQARRLWVEEGYSPEEIVAELIRESQGNGQLEGLRVPSKATGRQLIQHWAKVHGWRPHWREARETVKLREKEAFGITGITDPIWHLIQLHFKAWRESHVLTERTLEDALTEIERMYDPGVNALRRLRERLTRELRSKNRTS